MFWLWAALMWVGFAALAIGLGALRVLFLQPLVDEPVAHVVGTLVGCALFLALICRFVRWTNLAVPSLGAPGPHARGRLVALGQAVVAGLDHVIDEERDVVLSATLFLDAPDQEDFPIGADQA